MSRVGQKGVGNTNKGKILLPGHMRALQAKKVKSSKSLRPQCDKLPSPRDEPVEALVRSKKGGGRLPLTALVNPMFSRQSGNNGNNVNASQENPSNDIRSLRPESPRIPMPNVSPLNNDFLSSPRRNPRFLRRNLETEYGDLSSPLRTQGHRLVSPTADNEINQHPDQVRGSRTSASQRSERTQHNVLPSSAASQLNRGSQRQDSPGVHSVAEIQSFSQRNPSPSASNSPLRNSEETGKSKRKKSRKITNIEVGNSPLDNSEETGKSKRKKSRKTTNIEVGNSPLDNSEETGKPKRTKRGKTTNIEVGKRGKIKVPVDIYKGKICGVFRHQAINSIGSWVRQRHNCPLSYDEFDDMPDQNVDRVVQSVRDHFILIPDDDTAVKAIKDVMRGAYKRHRYRIHLRYKRLLRKFGCQKMVKSHPPKICRNKHDWAHMCDYFTTPEFKKKSARGKKSVGSKTINHSTGNRSHISMEYKLVVQEKKPCDPVILFSLTHNSKQMNDKCKKMKADMEAMKEASERGETNESPEEIYYKCRDAERVGKRRRRDPQTHRSLYQEKEEEAAQFKARITALEQENKRLKELTDPNVTKKFLDDYFAKLGLPPVELSDEDDVGDDDEDVDMHEGEVHKHDGAPEGAGDVDIDMLGGEKHGYEGASGDDADHEEFEREEDEQMEKEGEDSEGENDSGEDDSDEDN